MAKTIKTIDDEIDKLKNKIKSLKKEKKKKTINFILEDFESQLGKVYINNINKDIQINVRFYHPYYVSSENKYDYFRLGIGVIYNGVGYHENSAKIVKSIKNFLCNFGINSEIVSNSLGIEINEGIIKKLIELKIIEITKESMEDYFDQIKLFLFDFDKLKQQSLIIKDELNLEFI